MKQKIKKLSLKQETLRALNQPKQPKPNPAYETQTACGTCHPLLCP